MQALIYSPRWAAIEFAPGYDSKHAVRILGYQESRVVQIESRAKRLVNESPYQMSARLGGLRQPADARITGGNCCSVAKCPRRAPGDHASGNRSMAKPCAVGAREG